MITALCNAPQRTARRPLLAATAAVLLAAAVAPLDTASAGERGGYIVEEVAPAMPAARAGIRAGDRIIAVDGRSVRSDADVAEVVGAKGGRAVTVEIERGGRRVRVRVAPREATRAEREIYVVHGRRTIGLVHTEFGLRFGTGSNDYIPPPPIPPDPVVPPPPPPQAW